MQFLFAHARTSRHDAADSAATQAKGAAPVKAGPADGPQDLSAFEMMFVSGGSDDALALPVTKW